MSLKTDNSQCRCPHCGKDLPYHTVVVAEKERPVTGDISICAECGTPSQFVMVRGILTMAKLTDEDWNAIPLEQRANIALGCSMIRSENPTIHAEYVADVELIRTKAKEWRQLNPGKEAKIQFNYPNHVVLVMPISQALGKVVVANEAGRELIRACCKMEGTDESTVCMLRIALEMP